MCCVEMVDHQPGEAHHDNNPLSFFVIFVIFVPLCEQFRITDHPMIHCDKPAPLASPGGASPEI